MPTSFCLEHSLKIGRNNSKFFLFQNDLTVTCIGVALRQVIQGIVGKKITAYFELVILKTIESFYVHFELVLGVDNGV